MLVAFQYVGDIGYIGTLFSMPFALPLQPLMRKLGINYRRVTPIQLHLQMDQPTESRWMIRAIWWILFALSTIVFAVVSIATQPIMLAYLLISRPLMGINKLLNLAYEKSVAPWDFLFLTLVQGYISKMGMTNKKYADRELLKIRKKKGEIPFLALIGVLCIVAAFILHIVQ
jgi:hypothetical protein